MQILVRHNPRLDEVWSAAWYAKPVPIVRERKSVVISWDRRFYWANLALSQVRSLLEFSLVTHPHSISRRGAKMALKPGGLILVYPASIVCL